MLDIKVLPHSHGFASNTYLLAVGGECAVIDPSAPYNEGLVGGRVKYILLTHAHFDHMLDIDEWVEKTGAEVLVGHNDIGALPDSERNCYMLLTRRDHGYYGAATPVFKSTEIYLGGEKIRVISTPGHTPGVISMFWNTRYKGVEYLAGMFGGAGLGALSGGALARAELPKTMREDYVRSVNRIIGEPVEVHIGNHPGNNEHIRKAAALTEDYNPFVEERTWVPFLERMRDKVIEDYGIKI